MSTSEFSIPNAVLAPRAARWPWPTTIADPAVVALAGIASIACADWWVRGVSLFQEGNPWFSAGQVVRSGAIALCTVLLAHALATRSHGHASREHATVPRIVGTAALALPFVGLFAAVLALVQPALFSSLAHEDGLIENASAAGMLLASGTFALGAKRAWSSERLSAVASGVAAILAFVIAGEEVSWLQRQLEIATPGAFADNLQSELNAHNFATSRFEFAYYAAAWAYLLVLPACAPWIRRAAGPHATPLLALLPSEAIGFAVIPIVTFNYDMWMALPTQLAAYFTLAFLGFRTMGATARAHWLWGALGAGVTIQLLLLYGGPSFPRAWDATEWKELFIPIGVLLASLEVATRLGRMRR